MCNEKECSIDVDRKIKCSTCNLYTPLKDTKPIKDNGTLRKTLAQVLLTSAVMLTSASCGMPVGYSAILLPQLKSANGTMQIDDEMGSWIASLHSAATPFGSLLSGVLMDRIGRKFVLQLASVPLILGWILITLSENHAVLLLGRVIAGLSAGLSAAAGQVLIGESTEPRLRGMLSSGPFASYSFGILLVYALGSLLSWRYVAGLSTILPLLAIFAFTFLPESPVFLIRHNKQEEALKSLSWLRGGRITQAKNEIEHLLQRAKSEGQIHKESIFSIFTKPNVMKPLLIINIFNILQILSGTYLVVFYAVDILSNINGKLINQFLAASLTACVRFIFTIIASLLLALIGRRKIALMSGIGSTISALCLGIILQQDCEQSHYLTALFTLTYVAANTLGFFVLPGVMLSELFPAKVRGHAGGITFMLFNFALFGIAKIFPFIKNSIGIHGVFLIFGLSSLLASLFLYLVLPETKGKSLSYIEDYFQQNNFVWAKRDKNWEKKLHGSENERLNKA